MATAHAHHHGHGARPPRPRSRPRAPGSERRGVLGRPPDRRLHAGRGRGRRAGRLAGARGRRRAHADRRGLAGLAWSPSASPGRLQTAAAPTASTGSDPGRVHERRRLVPGRRLDRGRGGRPPSRARARARRRHAGDRGLGPPRQRRLSSPSCTAATAKPERARRHPARAGRHAGLRRRHPGRRHHPAHRLDAGRPDPVGAGEPARAAAAWRIVARPATSCSRARPPTSTCGPSAPTWSRTSQAWRTSTTSTPGH